MKKILVNGAMKAWKTLGAKQFMRMQLHSNPIDIEQAFRADNLIENEKALSTATVGGIFAAAEDIAFAFDDWSADIEAAPLQITAIHGVDDELFPIDGIRDLTSNFAHKMKLIEVPDAGFTMIQSHTPLIMDHLASIAQTHHQVS